MPELFPEGELDLRNAAPRRFRREGIQKPADEERRNNDDCKADPEETAAAVGGRDFIGVTINPGDGELKADCGDARNQAIDAGAEDRPCSIVKAMRPLLLVVVSLVFALAAGAQSPSKIAVTSPPYRGPYRYFFRLFALDRKLDLGAGAKRQQLDKAMAGHILARGEMIGRFSR